MKKLNEKSTAIFQQLIKGLKDQQHLRIANEPFMPLTIEAIGVCEAGEKGTAKLYSLCHYYEQNGDLMQDPEMCFMVIEHTGEWEVYPYLFQQANFGAYMESILILNNQIVKVHHKIQEEHTAFANKWLANIQAQGYLRWL